MIDTRTIIPCSLLLCAAILASLSAFAQEAPAPAVVPESIEDARQLPPADVGKTVTQQEATKDAAKTAPKKPRAMDRLELESTAITGNRELPKVLYIVPWKKSDLGDLTGRPANSLLDEVLAPVDREVFRRQTRYFDKLNSGPVEAPTEKE